MKKGKHPSDVRVVITGLGTINPLGISVREYWDNLKIGKSGTRSIQAFDASMLPAKIAAEVDMPDLQAYLKDKKQIKRLDRYILMGLVACFQAVKDSGLNIEESPHRYGCMIGTGDGGLGSHVQHLPNIIAKGHRSAPPYYLLNVIPSSGAGFVAKEWNLQGPSFSVSSACATSNHIIGLATYLIRLGLADAIFTGGAEATIDVVGIAAFSNLFALSLRNDSPETASRPFDKTRNGFVMGEGSGVLCIEELEHAKKRGAKIYAEITGSGFSCDASDPVAPHPEARGAVAAMTNALEEAELNPEDIELINAHATATPVGDTVEAKAIRKTFGTHTAKVMVHSTKSMTGHLLGAAGAIEAIAAIMAFEEGVVHPTINQFEPDPEIDLNIVRMKSREAKVDHILSNAFGFGGQNAAVILSRFRD